MTLRYHSCSPRQTVQRTQVDQALRCTHLQEPSELGVPVRYVASWFAIHQCADNITKSAQGQVDLGRFFKSISSGPSLALPLAAGKIHQIQLANSDCALATVSRAAATAGMAGAGDGCSGVFLVCRFNGDGED